jgi:hypothetical protein
MYSLKKSSNITLPFDLWARLPLSLWVIKVTSHFIACNYSVQNVQAKYHLLMRLPLIAGGSFIQLVFNEIFLEPCGHKCNTCSNHHGTVWSRFHAIYLPFYQHHFPDTGNGVITLCSKWSAFVFTICQRYLPPSEPQRPLIDMWLGHAFLLVDIWHHLYCLCPSLAQFNTKSVTFCHATMCTDTCGFSLSHTSYCILIPDHNVHSSCIGMCGTSLSVCRQYFTGTLKFIRPYWLYYVCICLKIKA